MLVLLFFWFVEVTDVQQYPHLYFVAPLEFNCKETWTNLNCMFLFVKSIHRRSPKVRYNLAIFAVFTLALMLQFSSTMPWHINYIDTYNVNLIPRQCTNKMRLRKDVTTDTLQVNLFVCVIVEDTGRKI